MASIKKSESFYFGREKVVFVSLIKTNLGTYRVNVNCMYPEGINNWSRNYGSSHLYSDALTSYRRACEFYADEQLEYGF